MTTVPISLEQLGDYVDAAISTDEDIVRFYDRTAGVQTPKEAAENIMQKIVRHFYYATFVGVEVDGRKVGYFVYNGDLLISFSLAPDYRNEHCLRGLWDAVVACIGREFHCILYAYNRRAIGWLKKCGMQPSYEEVTILHYNTLNYDTCPQ